MELIRFDGETMSAIRQLTRALNGESKKEIDWEQRRYEIAKDILAAVSGHEGLFVGRGKDNATGAVILADLLIKELKETQL